MNTQSKNASNKTVQDFQKDIDELIEETKAVNAEVNNIKKDFDDSSAPVIAKINKDAEDAENMMSELDKVEEESGDELDKLILTEAEEVEAEDDSE